MKIEHLKFKLVQDFTIHNKQIPEDVYMRLRDAFELGETLDEVEDEEVFNWLEENSQDEDCVEVGINIKSVL
jgi:hypothetical protein